MSRILTSRASKVAQDERPKKEIIDDRCCARRVESLPLISLRRFLSSGLMPHSRKGWTAERKALSCQHLGLSHSRNKENSRQPTVSSEAWHDLPGTSATLQQLLDRERANKDEYKHQLHSERRTYHHIWPVPFPTGYHFVLGRLPLSRVR